MEDGLFYEAVFSVEADGLRVMFPEQIEGVYDGVGIAEEPEDASASGQENTTKANVTTEDNTPQ